MKSKILGFLNIYIYTSWEKICGKREWFRRRKIIRSLWLYFQLDDYWFSVVSLRLYTHRMWTLCHARILIYVSKIFMLFIILYIKMCIWAVFIGWRVWSGFIKWCVDLWFRLNAVYFWRVWLFVIFQDKLFRHGKVFVSFGCRCEPCTMFLKRERAS